jgi:hypothetical protein
MNIQSVPSEAGPDLNGIEQGITNDEVEIATALWASQCPGHRHSTSLSPGVGGLTGIDATKDVAVFINQGGAKYRHSCCGHGVNAICMI